MLRAYPLSVRLRFGEDMTEVFRQSYSDCGGRSERFSLWSRTVRDVASNGFRARVQSLFLRLRRNSKPFKQRSSSMQSFLQDSRIAIRSFVRNPVFAAIAVVTLALGIGATTTIYSVVDAVLLRALPYSN